MGETMNRAWVKLAVGGIVVFFSANALAASALNYSLSLLVENPNYVLVEDCEDNNNQNLFGGYWYTYKDALTTILPAPGAFAMTQGSGVGNSQYFVHVTAAISPGGWAGVGTSLNSSGGARDIYTLYQGIRMLIKGDGYSHRFEITSSHQSGADTAWGYVFPTTASWQQVEILFNALSGGTGITMQEALTNATGFNWNWNGAASSNYLIDLDNLELKKR